MSAHKLIYTLRIADNALIIGHRLSEWCGHGPILEQDIAITNIALDHLGQSRSLYQYAAEQFNTMPAEEKNMFFSSVALQNSIAAGGKIDEDDLAYLRDSWDFRNVLLAEQPNKDWAYTIARALYFDTFNYYLHSELRHSKDETLAAIAEKSLKEITYHLRWSSEWAIRLGDGTEESHNRMQAAIDDLWMYTGEPVTADSIDRQMKQEGIGVELSTVANDWRDRITDVLQEATLNIPKDTWMQEGGKDGRHTEHLGFILAELQFMQRAYPGMEW